MKRKNLLFALLLALGLPWVANAQTRATQTFDFEDNAIPSTWTNDATYPWVVTDAKNHTDRGAYCIKSSIEGQNSKTSSIEATFNFLDDGSISFYCWASCESASNYWDYGIFYIDGTQMDRFLHVTDWVYKTYTVDAGTHTFKWTYTKDSSAANNDDCFYVDDIVVDLGEAQAFPKPTGLAVSNVLHNEATLSWTENGTATAWQIGYTADGGTEQYVSVTENPYTLTGLTPLTTYEIRVQSDYQDDTYSLFSNPISFSTTAVAEAVGDAWSDDFEGETCGWELINGNLADAWVWGTATNNGGTHAIYISDNGGTAWNYSHNSVKVLAAKLLTFTEGKFTFSYDWNCYGESNYDFLRVALVPASQTLTAGSDYSTISTTSLPSGWIALDGGGKLNQVQEWQNKEVAVNVTAGNYYLVLAWRSDTSTQNQPPAAVDNVSITKIACDHDVTDLSVSNITTTGATLSWEGGEARQWQVVYSTASNFENAIEEIVDNNAYDLTRLDNSTIYYVKVRAYCGGEDYGSWSETISFATACESIAALGYSENFDSYTAASGFLPLCWNRINEGTNTTYNQYPYLSSYGSNSGNCLRFYAFGTTSTSDQYAILPEMTGLEGKQISLMAKAYNNGNVLKIGMMTDPDDVTTFVEIASETLTTSYQPLEYILGQGNYVAFLMEAPTSSSTTVGIYIDDIAIAEAPTCFRPTDLEFVNSTTNSATIGWTNGAEGQTAWQIAYSTDPAFNPDEVTPVDVTSNPGTINNLTAATTYYAYVRANCGNNGYSDWSYAYCMFNTECDAITISDEGWTENFNSYTAGATSTSTPSAYPNDVLPTCWQFLNRSETSGTYPQVFLSSYSSYVVSGNCLFFKSSSSTPMYAILPEFTEDIANLQLTFTYRNEGVSASNGTLIVGYMTDPTDATTFIAKHTCEQTTTLTEQEVLFTDAPARSYIAFMYQGGSANNYYLSIDNVSVNYPPTCVKPSNLVFVSSTTTEATLSWTNGAEGQTAWQIAYSTDPAFDPNEVTPTNVTSNPGIISGLTAATTYYAYVRANCGNDDYSDWSSAYVQFDTECDVIVVDATHPFTEGFDGITSGIPVCWDNSEGTTSDASYRWNYYATGYKGHCVRFNSYNNSADNTNFLKTPVMNLPQEGDNLQLSFWYKNPEGGDFSVFISTDGGDTYTTALASDLTDQSDWTNEVISLSEYAGNENVVIVFAGTSNWGYGDAYIYLDEVFVGMPFTKHIIGYASDEEGSNGNNYYLIASPLAGAVDPTTVGMITDNLGVNATPETSTYDLYRFDEALDLEWVNYRGHENDFSLVNGQAYLYACKNGTTLTFTGTPYSGDAKTVTLSRTDNEDVDFQGWNLVGNPFAEEAYIEREYFYVMDGNGAEIIAEENTSRALQPMEGIFVVADHDGEEITFTKQAPGAKANIVLNLTQGRGNTIDRAIVGIGQGRTLPKFMLNPNNTKLYIPQNGEDYAAVRSLASGEIPVSFVPAEDGFFTISVDVRNMNLRSLILKDYVRNVSIDLLRTPNYMFKASVYDRADRFILSFRTSNSIYKEKFVKGANPEDFSFYSNGVFVIDNEGEATLQVIHLHGRVLSSENIYGSTSVQVDAAPGVYMLRLANGDNVKVQKVVVR